MTGIADRLTNATTLLQVFDMPRSIRFYRDSIGFRVVSTSSPRDGRSMPGDDCDWAMLEAGGGSAAGKFWLMLNTAYEADERPAAPDLARALAHGDTAIYFACDDPDAIYGLLREAGLEPQAPMTAPYGMRQVYLKDPDGYELCFQCPVRSESSEATS